VISGPTPGSSLGIADVFMNVDMELCNMAPIQLYDFNGGTFLSQKSDDVKEVKSSNSKLSEVKLSDEKDDMKELFRLMKKMKVNEVEDIDGRIYDRDDLKKIHSDGSSFDRISLGSYLDDDDEFGKSKNVKSSSIKSIKDKNH